MLRRGPGLVRVAATTAVVAGTARATTNAMDRRAYNKQMQQQAVVQSQDNQQQIADLQAQNAALAQQQQALLAQQQAAAQQPAAAPPPAAAAAPANDMMAQLNQLAQLHSAGVLSDEEFAAAKAKLLAG